MIALFKQNLFGSLENQVFTLLPLLLLERAMLRCYVVHVFPSRKVSDLIV
jgi:hypothetical protein